MVSASPRPLISAPSTPAPFKHDARFYTVCFGGGVLACGLTHPGTQFPAVSILSRHPPRSRQVQNADHPRSLHLPLGRSQEERQDRS